MVHGRSSFFSPLCAGCCCSAGCVGVFVRSDRCGCGGAGGVFGPPDKGFPATGVIAEGALNGPGWTYAQIDLGAVAEVRRAGGVRNRTHWAEQGASDGEVTYISLL